MRLDVTDEASIAQAIEHIEQEAGHLDLLLNNAGFSLSGAVPDASNAQIRHQFETNVIGVIATTRAALQLMRRHHRERVIKLTITPIGFPTGADGERMLQMSVIK